MMEKDVEAYLRRRVNAAGGVAYKWVSPGNNGVPDRLVCLPGGRIYLVETKAPGKSPRPSQVNQHRRLQALGVPIWVLDSKDAVDQFMGEVGSGGI